MSLKDYWSKPATEQDAALEGVYPPTKSRCRVIYACPENEHVPNEEKTHCIKCTMRLAPRSK
jgi:hypothetical protein